MSTILVIDDEPQIRRVLRHALQDEFGRVVEAGTAREGVDLAASLRPELVVLDLGLPDASGATVCHEIRQWSNVPIIVLSARHGEREKAAMLDAGVDDYITKPFGTRELQARVRAQLRRARSLPHTGQEGPIEVEGVTIDLARRTCTRDGEEIHLTPIEWDILRTLLAAPGRVLTQAQIFRSAWGKASGDAPVYLRVHIANLRRKIERDPVRPRLILTEPGVGYRFRPLD